MSIVKPISSLRSKNHVHTRLELRDERTIAYRVYPYFALIYVAYSFVDASSTGGSLLFFALLRGGAVTLGLILYILTRGRVRYGARILLFGLPFAYAVQYIMIRHDLSFGSYAGGLILLLMTTAILFPMRWRIGAPVQAMFVAPLMAWLLTASSAPTQDLLNLGMMLAGAVLINVIAGDLAYGDFFKRLTAQEALARDLGMRDKIIRGKAAQLLKRKAFESQFSPQVVSAVLSEGQSLTEMSDKVIVTLVIDIEGSTQKASHLPAEDYKNVVEEVFDVFASSCLSHNITVDKFTGDGAMAFAGAPTSSGDDVLRAIEACSDIIMMLEARRGKLEALWQDRLNVRFAISEGKAKVGFLGRGTLKSYTAIGDSVSLAHRLCSRPAPWTIALYSWIREESVTEQIPAHFQRRSGHILGLKGYGQRSFKAHFLSIDMMPMTLVDSGRCPLCETPLIQLQNGISNCPGCDSRSQQEAA